LARCCAARSGAGRPILSSAYMIARRPLTVLVPALVLAALQARAADQIAECVTASEKGQVLRDNSKLVEAREEFTSCARPVCPSLLQKDCAQWLADVNAVVPSVVFVARDASGKDLLEVRVLDGDRVIAETLGGTRVYVNPGRHAFRFQSASGEVEQVVIVRE